MEVSGFRTISPKTQKEIKDAVEKNDHKKLILALIDTEVELFPIKDSYVAHLRADFSALDKNPETLRRIGERLVKMGFDEIIRASTQPKETNRQMGPLFRKWINKLGYPCLDKDEFLKHQGPALLNGSDKTLKKFAKEHLGVQRKKGLDLILKKGDIFVIGEAKFLTDFGGHQNAQFNDPHSLIHTRAGKVIKVAILDGVVWIPTGNKIHKAVKRTKKDVLSALLFKDFVGSL